MPDVQKKYQISLSPEQVYPEVIAALKQIGTAEVKESDDGSAKAAEGFVQSIWGWGGMNVRIRVEKAGTGTTLTAGGYIAQLATSPLAKKLDEFLDALAAGLKSKYGYDFRYEKMNSFLPSFSLNKKDAVAFGVIIGFGLIMLTVGVFIGRVEETLLSVAAVFLAYYWGRRYFYKK